MKESQIQTLFSKTDMPHGVYELKISKKNSIPYDAVAEHQVEALQSVRGDGFFHKITDNPVFGGMKTRFHSKKPFDCFKLKETPAYVALCFYKPRVKKELLCIPITDFLLAKNLDTRKSLTEENAKKISEFIVCL